MDLGIKNRRAVICASSEGLGRACAFELARAGCTIVINGRDAAKLEATAAEIRKETGATVHTVAADIGTSEGRTALLAAVPEVDILVNNNGGPPFRDFREVDEAAMRAGLEANMVTPAALVRAVVDGMIARKFGRIVNITSASVKQPLAGLDLSGGARAGLTGFLAGVARSVAHANVTINFLLPGTFETKRIQTNLAARAAKNGSTVDSVRAAAIAAIPAKRFGRPDEFGAACAFLCSAHAGYINGQSLLIDGGAFPGTL